MLPTETQGSRVPRAVLVSSVPMGTDSTTGHHCLQPGQPRPQDGAPWVLLRAQPEGTGGEGQEMPIDANFQERCRTAVTIPGARTRLDLRVPGAERGARLGPAWGGSRGCPDPLHDPGRFPCFPRPPPAGKADSPPSAP